MTVISIDETIVADNTSFAKLLYTEYNLIHVPTVQLTSIN